MPRVDPALIGPAGENTGGDSGGVPAAAAAVAAAASAGADGALRSVHTETHVRKRPTTQSVLFNTEFNARLGSNRNRGQG